MNTNTTAPTQDALALPERNPAISNAAQGMYRKFDVRRTDGRDSPGGDRAGADYFVLDVTHDPHARAALAAYANAAESTHPQLAADMRDRYGLPPTCTLRLAAGLARAFITMARIQSTKDAADELLACALDRLGSIASNTAAGRYRLLTRGEAMQVGDEYLKDDAQTWAPIRSSYYGEPWRDAFGNVRRKCITASGGNFHRPQSEILLETQPLYASPQPAASGAGPQLPDAIAMTKRILALVDEYHEKPTQHTRTALRMALTLQFQALGVPSSNFPVLYVSEEQLPLLGTTDAQYVSYRLNPEGKFQLPLYRLAVPGAALAAAPAAAPHGWLYDWTHAPVGKPAEVFTGFTTDEASARNGKSHCNVRAVYLQAPAAAQPLTLAQCVERVRQAGQAEVELDALVSRRALAAAQAQPLTDAQINALHSASEVYEYHPGAVREFARELERMHGIGQAGSTGDAHG